MCEQPPGPARSHPRKLRSPGLGFPASRRSCRAPVALTLDPPAAGGSRSGPRSRWGPSWTRPRPTRFQWAPPRYPKATLPPQPPPLQIELSPRFFLRSLRFSHIYRRCSLPRGSHWGCVVPLPHAVASCGLRPTFPLADAETRPKLHT